MGWWCRWPRWWGVGDGLGAVGALALGLSLAFGRSGRLRPLVGSQDHRHVAPVELGVDLDPSHVGDVGGHLVEDALAQLGVLHLPASEHDGHLDLVSLTQELLDLLGLGVEVAVPDLGPVLHLLDHDVGALATGFLGPLGGLVLVLAVVHDPTDRRVGLVGHLDQIELELAGHGQRLGQRSDADLLPVGRHQAHLAGSDPIVDPRLVVRGGSYRRSLLIDAQVLSVAWVGPVRTRKRRGRTSECRHPPRADGQGRRLTSRPGALDAGEATVDGWGRTPLS